MQKIRRHAHLNRAKVVFIAVASFLGFLVSSAGAQETEEALAKRRAQLAQCAGDYPKEARRDGATGTTKVRLSIDSEGGVTEAVVRSISGRSSSHRILDQTAVSILKCMSPYKKTGEPYSLDLEYVWRLN